MTKNVTNAASTGKRVVGGWHVTTRLGKGGNGEVFRAEKDGVVGAIKLLGQWNRVPGRVARFRDEVQASARTSPACSLCLTRIWSRRPVLSLGL